MKDKNSATVTVEYGGCFANETYRKEFLNLLDQQPI